MSNKHKNTKCLVEYVPTVGEHRHTAMVYEVKKEGYKHSGSKHILMLRNIIPIKPSSKLSSALRKLF